jgi:ATP-dependent Lon protease
MKYEGPDSLDAKLNEHFSGKAVRKDLLHQIKKSTNVPSFVLEFLLARYCATDDPDEVEAGKQAVVETLSRQYVRPDEANKAQSLVQQKGSHRFIDKIHVRYQERERRHWAAMENFNSQRIAIPEQFYSQNERLLEGGVWAEVKVARNETDESYAFHVEELRPVQLARFDFDAYCAGRQAFSRNEWLDVLMRTIGLNPDKFSFRLKLHYLTRLIGFVESNYNFIELGPRGTGKSFAFSEFSPYGTLISGGQASTATLFYNLSRRTVGLVGYWDIIGFDEVGGIRIKDQNTIQIMKDYMANGRFSRGAEVIADASFAFVGNIDHSIEQLVSSPVHTLFLTLPDNFDLAVQDRFHYFLPGWEMPKNSSSYLTGQYGLITDYLAEALHYLKKKVNKYPALNSRISLGKAVEGRDEQAIKKTVAGLLKLLHPADEPTEQEFDEYVAYAVEGRRRVKEQMNKQKPDDEFANINLSYWRRQDNQEEIVYCPESAHIVQAPGYTAGQATSSPLVAKSALVPPNTVVDTPAPLPENSPLTEKTVRILFGDTGYSYEALFGSYLVGASVITLEEPYIRTTHQLGNLVRFAELLTRIGDCRELTVRAGQPETDEQQAEVKKALEDLRWSLKEFNIQLEFSFSPTLHDRELRLSNGWVIRSGRGLDLYQKPENWFSVGVNDFAYRPCLETTVVFQRN